MALRAITALEATGGVSGLVSGRIQPLVRALSHPDRAVRFQVGVCAARAIPHYAVPVVFPRGAGDVRSGGRDRVAAALVVAKEEGMA